MKHVFVFLILIANCLYVLAQKQELVAAQVKGRVTDALTNEALSSVSVTIQELEGGVSSDSLGNYILSNLKPGVYDIQFSRVGYKKKMAYDVQVSNAKPTMIDIALELEAATLGEVRVNAPVIAKTLESPVSLRSIGATEIKRNPGGNRDISKVIQSLPGVSTQVSFRNDIIIRGGAPNENKFYLDGVEIPNINHFSTQGSSGGPVGMINVDFLREVDFYSGAFPANRGNTLSSVFDFKQKDGRDDKLGASITLGATDLAATLEGPLSSKTTFISSYRYSYLQGLFKLLQLPFLPSYQDFQFKIKTKFNSKHELTWLGLGAIDRFKLNFNTDRTEANLYILANVPVNSQDNYTLGAVYKNYRSKGYTNWVLSRSFLNNKAIKYQDNDANKIKTIDYSSKEIENKFRIENTSREGGYKITYGAQAETAEYSTNTLTILPFGTEQYQSKINFIKYGFFTQLSRSFFNDKLNLSAGLRTDGNTYSSKMNNPLKTLSPRLSAAYNLAGSLFINANAGIYYQLPAYTVLGYREFSGGPLLNKSVEFVRSKQAVLGLEYSTSSNTRFTVEGFYKQYQQYPMVKVLGQSIPLANLGADFGVVGNKPVTGFTQGRSYGLEFFAQQRLTKGFYGIFALTAFRSEFKDINQKYVPSSWNSRYIVSMTAGKILPRNWEIGTRFRLTGGSPYTPYDIGFSSLKSNYSIYPQGIQDYTQLNTQYLANFYQLDIRVDKKYPFKKFSLNVYLDIQNLTYNKYETQPALILDRDLNGMPQDDPADPAKFKTKLLKNESGNILPTIGVIFEW